MTIGCYRDGLQKYADGAPVKCGRTFGYEYPGVDLIKGSGYGQVEK